jgi:hypothetical protein
MNNIFNTVKKTASGIVIAEPCIFGGFFLGTDSANDPTITVYDNAAAASGEELVPTTEYDASVLGLNGAIGFSVLARNGVYIEITTAGTCEVTVLYHMLSQIQLNRTQVVL